VHALWYHNNFDLIGPSNSNFPFDSKAACIYDVKVALDVKPGTNGEENLPEGKLAVVIVAPVLGTNVLSTSLIAWKAWCAAHPRETHFSFLSALLTEAS
jgi:hypothetical protein